MNPKVGGSSHPSGGDIFCLKIFDAFTRTPVCVSKINAVARVQLTFQMLTLLQKDRYESVTFVGAVTVLL